MSAWQAPNKPVQTEEMTIVLAPSEDVTTTTVPTLTTPTSLEKMRKKYLKNTNIGKHEHMYNRVTGQRVIGTNKVILSWVCGSGSCEQMLAFDLLPRDKAMEMYKVLNHVS